MNDKYECLADIIAGKEFFQASSADHPEVMAEYGRSAMERAIRRMQKDPSYPNLLVVQARSSLKESSFFSGRFRTALRLYEEDLTAPQRTKKSRTRTLFSVAFCQLGGNDPGVKQTLEQLFSQIDSKDPGDAALRYQFKVIQECLELPAVFGDKARWTKLLGSWQTDSFEIDERYYMNIDLMRVLKTCGQGDAAVRLILREIRNARTKDAKDPAAECHYLKLLGSTLTNDIFPALSFQGSRSRGFTRIKKVSGEERVEDFAPYWERNDDPRVKGAQLARYGMTNPEEDIVSCIEFVGFNELNGRQKDTLDWVLGQLSGSPPSPTPLLKIAFTEWFYVPFGKLKLMNFDIGKWVYDPVSASKVTSDEKVEQALTPIAVKMGGRILKTWTIFRDVRQFLLVTYGKRD